MTKPSSGLDDTATPDQAAMTEPPSGTAAAPAPTDETDHFPPQDPGRYKVGREVGRGGLGRVLDAHDRVLDRHVAIKELHDPDGSARTRFLREALITARLQHPSIVPIYEAGRWRDGSPFYAMKLVAGRPFSNAIAEAKNLSERLALIPIVLAVSDALAYAHSHHIVHRDLKPGNVLVGEFGETVVIDWGLAKDLSVDDRDALDAGPYRHSNQDQTIVGQLIGTPAYMAPEQASGLEVDERADVYALGAILFHVVAGASPHRGTTLDAMLRDIVAGDILSIESVPGVPPDLAAVIGKALQQDPAQRYPTAKELADDLRRFQTGQLVASYRYTRRELVARFVRRHRLPVLTIAAAAVALAIGGAIAVMRVLDERDRADLSAQLARDEKAVAVEMQRKAEDREEKLILQHARTKVASNPTEAIAMMKPLARRHWREVASLANAARAHGVAWSMTELGQVRDSEFSRDGERLLVVTYDGSIRIANLRKRTSRTIVVRHNATEVRFVDDERKAVVFDENGLDIVDLASGKFVGQRQTASIRELEVVGSTIFWIEPSGKLWRWQMAGAPAEVPLREPVRQIWPSQDGTWMVLGGIEHVMLLALARTEPPVELALGGATSVDWNEAGDRFAAVLGDDATSRHLVEVTTVPAPMIVRRFFVGNKRTVVYRDGRMFVSNSDGVSVFPPDDDPRAWHDEPGALGETRTAVVRSNRTGTTLVTTTGAYRIAGVADALPQASSRSSFLVASNPDGVVVWESATVVPEWVGRAPATARFAGTDHLLTVAGNDVGWIDLASGRASPVGSLPAASETIVTSPVRNAACLIDVTHAGHLVDGTQVVPLGQVDLAVFAGDDLVIGMNDASGAGATVARVDRSGKRSPLVGRRAGVVGLAAGSEASPWFVAVFFDGVLWRRNLKTGATSETKLAKPPAAYVVGADGTVFYLDGRKLHAWRSDRVETLRELPDPSTALRIAGPDHVVAFSNETDFLVGLRDGSVVAYPDPGPGYASESGLTVLRSAGSIDLVDPWARHRWRLATDVATPDLPIISRDGRYVVATYAEGGFLVWRLVQPAGPDETSAWLDQLTNATFDATTARLVFTAPRR